MSLLNNNKFFEIHPEKILGKEVTHNPNTGRRLTDAYGNEVNEVWGDISNVQAIDVPKVKRYKHFEVSAKEILTDNDNVTVEAKKIEAIIKKTKQDSTYKDSVKEGGKLRSLKESILLYNTDIEYTDYSSKKGVKRTYTITEDEIKVWITYQVSTGLYDKDTIINNDWSDFYIDNPSDKQYKAWFDKDLIAYDGAYWIPSSIYYSGNIYENLNKLKKNEYAIIEVIGNDGYDRQLSLMNEAMPQKLKITDDESRKLYLLPFHRIWDEITIDELADGSEVDNDSFHGTHIKSLFYFNYLKDLPEEDFTFEKKSTTAWYIYNYWVLKKPLRGFDPIEKAAIQRNSALIGGRLFDRFLIEALREEDKRKIEHIFNSKYNHYKAPEYHRIPVGFDINKYFKSGELKLRPAQREGVAFMSNRGVGIVAYDVGVGKTMTAIAGISDGMNKGLFKRPLVVVPQKVYKKWIAEINGIKKGGKVVSDGILPHIKINDFDNLGVKILPTIKSNSGIVSEVDPFSITMVTFEGLEKIGFNKDTEVDLLESINAILSQAESGRKRAIGLLKGEEWIDKALQKTEVDIEDLGIDCIIVDEAHNFRNLFKDIPGDVSRDGEREKKHFQASQGGQPSNRAVKLLILSMYISDKNKKRNIFGLTATPFTNRATEIFSMLSMFDTKGLKDFGMFNLAQFCANYIDETYEDVWTAKGFSVKAVIRGYNNLSSLQSLVFNAINYKTGEEADILRPEKVILPLHVDDKGVPLSSEYVIETSLPATIKQKKWFEDIRNFVTYKRDEKGAYLSPIFDDYIIDPRKNKVLGDSLIALNLARAVTISPYLNPNSTDYPSDISYTKFIDSSPKLKYICECIRTVKEYHNTDGSPMSGQIIYSGIGKEWFVHIERYLIEEVGLKSEEVAQFHSGVTKSKREKIKNDFQSNKIKVIIGTSTLREGVDLQNHCSVIYLAYLDWNPTDLHQLMGRGWRFGNKHTHIRIVVPLIENSADIFTWQKLSEKMSRINSVWSRANKQKVFEEGELNAEELKMGLITDPEEIADMQIKENIGEVISESRILEGHIESLEYAVSYKDDFYELSTQIDKLAKEALSNPQNVSESYFEKIKGKKITDQKSKYRIIRKYADFKDYWYEKSSLKGKVDRHLKLAKKMRRLEEQVLKNFNLTIYDDTSEVLNNFKSKLSDIKDQMLKIKTPEYKERIIEQITAEKEDLAKKSKPVAGRIKDFARLNYLLDCFQGHHTCDIMGRVVELKTGKVNEAKIQAVQDFDLNDNAYTFSKTLLKFLNYSQKKAVEEILKGEKGKGYIESVLNPLEKQLESIPMLYSTENTKLKEKVIHAHFFLGGSDWYIAEWDGKDTLFGFVRLNNDNQNAEWGNISLKELNSLWEKGMNLDFHWKTRPFNETELYEDKYGKSNKSTDDKKQPNPSKAKRIRIAKAKAKALKLKLELLKI